MMDIQSTNFKNIKSISNNTWCYKPINNELKNQVKKDLDIEKITASILANRGIEGPDLAVFLDHTLKNNMPDPAGSGMLFFRVWSRNTAKSGPSIPLFARIDAVIFSISRSFLT